MESPLGPKPANNQARILEAKRLTYMMVSIRPFSFIRMGDMDAELLIKYCNNESSNCQFAKPIGKSDPYGTPGISINNAERLKRAFEKSHYVDFNERLFPMRELLKKVPLQRSQKLFKNSSEETSYISLTWLEYEFKDYCQDRKICIAGAEARLLQTLTSYERWRSAAENYWPDRARILYYEPPERGKNLDKNLDRIKSDLKNIYAQEKYDTLFLSLGGAAKILCYELASELGICTFDFGALLRALTYSGSDGQQTNRSTHSPYLFRLPFDLYMEAIEKTYPNMSPIEILCKAHAQLLLEVQKKEVGWTHTAWEYDFNKENIDAFKASFKEYKRKYHHIFRIDDECKRERKNFLWFCGVNRLTCEGILYYKAAIVKGYLNKILNIKS